MDIEKEVKEIHKKYESWNDSRMTEFESDLESWLYEQDYDIDDVSQPLAYICGYKAGVEAVACCGACKWWSWENWPDVSCQCFNSNSFNLYVDPEGRCNHFTPRGAE